MSRNICIALFVVAAFVFVSACGADSSEGTDAGGPAPSGDTDADTDSDTDTDSDSDTDTDADSDSDTDTDSDTDADSDADSDSDPVQDSDAGTDSGPDEGCTPMKVMLPPCDFKESDVAKEDREYLNDLATEYVCGLNGAPIDDDYFMYGWAPIKLFNQIIDNDIEDIEKMRWVFYVSGFFGGVWLTNGLHGTGETPDGGLDVDAGLPGNLGMLNGAGIARRAVTATEGTDAQLFTYNKAILLAFMIPELGIAWDFGYNRGYLLEIYLRPPKNITPPEDYVECEGPLWCEYSDQRIPVLATLKEVSDNLANKAGRWKDLRGGGPLNPMDGVTAAQSTANTMGMSVWGTVFNKNDMSEPDFYMGLLDVSASFLEVVQAAGLLSAKGYAEQDAEAGRAGALIQSGLGMWLASYMKAFGGPVGNKKIEPVPRIEPK